SVRRWRLVGFKQQLGGVADGTERVANLMGNARRQTTEGGEIQLLRFLGKPAIVFDEDQRVRLHRRLCSRWRSRYMVRLEGREADADVRPLGPGFQPR